MARKAISAKLRALVLTRDGSRCLMCGARASDLGVTLEVDHVVPVDEGGADDLDNLATLCRRCNRGKSNLRLKDYRSLSLIPADLGDHFRFYHDNPRPGDAERFHLYLYYLDRTGVAPWQESFHWQWDISATEGDTSPNRDALMLRRRAEEEEKFEQDIRRQLSDSLTRLVSNERGLQRISARSC
jgi:hypothetical protein